LLMVFEETPDVSQFVPGKAAAALEAHRVKPELRLATVAANVHVRRFLEAVCRVEVDAVRAFSKGGGHSAVSCFSGFLLFRTLLLASRPPQDGRKPPHFRSQRLRSKLNPVSVL
jgi:hypothetical protein